MAIKPFSGSLLSLDLLEGDPGGAEPRMHRADWLLSVLRGAEKLGPASGARQVFDLFAAPMLTHAGGIVTVFETSATSVAAVVSDAAGRPVATLAAAGWSGDLRRLRHATARQPSRWWIGTNGTTIRLLDATRAYSRRAIDIDVAALAPDAAAIATVQRLLDLRSGSALRTLDDLVAQSERHRADVGRSLQTGVESALARLVAGFTARRRTDLDAALSDALTVVYRILFLLFAEARGLVPQWHPVYRDSYTIESLRPIVESRRPPGGLWQSLQAIARLAHRGCTAGSLRVVPFNGRLFAPAQAPLAESTSLDDRVIADVLRAVTTRPSADRRERISYADLGVEQLGAVYERVLEYVPSCVDGAITMSSSGRRKRTGTFYTPRAMTEYLVRRTLAPLVRGMPPERVLSLRVVDPSMGSGAFLVAACRYLASAYENALVEEGSVARGDLSSADRAGFRRAVAQRCLYGVDSNPTAVQLARLSLWLCTLAADRPLTFLDHRLRTGNSVAGASIADVLRQPPAAGSRRSRGHDAQMALFDEADFAAGLSSAIGVRTALAAQPDDAASTVRMKERAIERLDGEHGPLRAWRQIADAWCAAWFWPADTPAPGGAAWSAFAAALRGLSRDLPVDVERRWRDTAAAIAAAERFFHWELEFPEVFYEPDGQWRGDAGFDAVIGNPPWAAAGPITRFSRDSGCYRLQSDGHANLYQLFAERMLRLTRIAGRVGMVVPSGLLTDAGCADLRRHLFDRCAVDAVVTFDNRDGLFPIHRGVRFALVTATTAGRTDDLRLRAGLRDPAALDDVPDESGPADAVRLPMTLLSAFDGDARAVPDARTDMDRAVLARVLSAGPPLARGWGAHFGRELNATDDRRHFGREGLPVLEGKLIEPFAVHVDRAERFIDRRTAARLLERRASFDRARLGYREVASATNRLTLIAAMIPGGTVTTHTVFCLRELLDDDTQWYLCGVLNSYVANYCVRLRGGTHVPAFVIHQLPVPLDVPADVVQSIAALARACAASPRSGSSVALQAQVARLYGLARGEFAHVLSTFPLIPTAERDAALRASGL